MTDRKFYKQVFTVEVLSEEPLPDDIELDGLSYEITEGHSSGTFKLVSNETLDGKQAAEALISQGSDPEFFRIDTEGKDLED